MIKDLMKQVEEIELKLNSINQLKDELEDEYNSYNELTRLTYPIKDQQLTIEKYIGSKRKKRSWKKLGLSKRYQTENQMEEHNEQLKKKLDYITNQSEQLKSKMDEMQKEINSENELREKQKELNQLIDVRLLELEPSYEAIKSKLTEIIDKKTLVEKVLENGKIIHRNLMKLKGQLEYMQRAQRLDDNLIGDFNEMFQGIRSNQYKSTIRNQIKEFNDELSFISEKIHLEFNMKKEFLDFENMFMNIFQVKRTDQSIQKTDITMWNLEDIIKEIVRINKELSVDMNYFMKRRNEILQNFLNEN